MTAEQLLAQLSGAAWNDGAARSVTEARRSAAAQSAALGGDRLPLTAVRDTALPGPRGDVGARVYHPTAGPVAGLVVWLHGGGFALGSVDESDPRLRALAAACDSILVAVEYRLAPEHPFPAGLLDCYAALRWAAECATELGAPGARIAVGGDSAGGNLAAAVALLARERGTPAIDLQVLVYPMTWCRGSAGAAGSGGALAYPSWDTIAWFWDLYLDGHDPADPLVSPLKAASLAGLPPALVVTAEHDTLREEGERYAARLAESGVPTELVRYYGMLHGFLDFGGVDGPADIAAAATDRIGRAVRSAFARVPPGPR